MQVADKLQTDNKNCEKHFSFEVLPPLKGNGTEALFRTLDILCEYNPLHINITTHHSEYVYRELEDGNFERQRIRQRPGTIAISAAIQQRYKIPVIPHIICSGATAEDIEYELIDLQFLGIENVLLLRGDKAKDDKTFVPTRGGYRHTTQLIEQVVKFNNGFFRLFINGTLTKQTIWQKNDNLTLSNGQFGRLCIPKTRLARRLPHRE